MTPTASEHPSSQEDWRSALRGHGYRLTPQRELVLAAVERLGHATPDEVLSAVREESQAVNVSTVYRTLELLEELGLVRHTHITDRAPTYHSTSGPEHIHLVCRSCQGVTEVELDVMTPLMTTLSEKFGFEVDVGHLTIFGVCGQCRGQ